LRERGNKCYTKGRFVQALEYYERAMSLFRWLELRNDKPEVNQHYNTEELSSQSECSDEDVSSSKIPINLGGKKEGTWDAASEFKEFTDQYK
jgi:hypothetical protein